MSAYLEHFGLRYGAFDFVVEPEGQWVFLECNPNGQWLWLEDEADQPISAALAAVLAGEEPS
jgi:D-alanine-D-alanine ligase-like ATP-grasp enzyme